MRDLGIDVYEVAAIFWGGGYDPSTEEVTEGPFVVFLPAALESAGGCSVRSTPPAKLWTGIAHRPSYVYPEVASGGS
jgi:hypothetical protein